MVFYTQTKIASETVRGNCLATSLACLLDKSIEDVPAFEEMARKEWRPALLAWLGEQGLTIKSRQQPPKGFAIAVGWSQRGNLHAVIVKDGEFYHDPDPHREFVTQVRDYWELLKIAEAA